MLFAFLRGCCLWRLARHSRPFVASMEVPANAAVRRVLGTWARLRFLAVPAAHLRCLGLLLLLFLFLGSVLHAQTGLATLSGQVSDASGKVVPGVSVVLTNLNTNVPFSTITNGDGIYNLSALPPGIYRANLSKDGFKSLVKGEIELHTQDSVSLNFALQVGSVSETVTVSANLEHMETDSPAIGLLVDRTFVENMPLNGRSLQDLIALTPGAASNSEGLYSFNGQRTDANYFTVDGVASNVSVAPGSGPDQNMAGVYPAMTALNTTQALSPVDSLQEFKIQTSGYSAEYGRQPGGQVQFTTRSGTNDFHGSVYDYFRNTVLDANFWFSNSIGFPRAPEHQNDFGGTFGGPVVVPHLYHGKDKTFFFVSYEGLRLVQPGNYGLANVPTLSLRQLAAPGIQPFLNSLPMPNGPANGDLCAASIGFTFSCTAQYRSNLSFPSTLNATSVRLDQVLGSWGQVFARYFDNPSVTSLLGPGTRSNLTTNTRTVTLGAAIKLRENFTSELRFNYAHVRGDSTSYPVEEGGSVPYPSTLLAPAQYASGGTPIEAGLGLEIPGMDFVELPSYYGARAVQNQYNIIANGTYVHLGHVFKFGGDYRRLLPVYFPLYSTGFSFTSINSLQQGTADLGNVSAGGGAYPTFNNLSLFAEDSWRVAPRLVIDYGIRWEFDPAPGASNGLYPIAVTTSNLTSLEVAPTGTPQFRTRYSNFAPRLGFAYRVRNSTTNPLTLRGGGGIFYDTGQALGAFGYGGYPFFASTTLTNVPFPISPSTVAPPSFGGPLVPPYGGINGASDPNLRLPYTVQWNISLAVGLSASNSLAISYVGNVGRDLLFRGLYTGSAVSAPFSVHGIYLTSNAASSSYNALQIQDQGYVAPGLQLIASYTWSHALDDNSGDGTSFPPIRGNSDYDLRQIFNLALNYAVPHSEANAWTRLLSGGWLLATRFAAQTGYPVDVYQGLYLVPNGSYAFIRPDIVPGVPVYLKGVPGILGGWQLNRNAFAEVPTDPSTGAPLRLGTLERNSIHGPGFWDLNVALQRDFAIRDSLKLIFRTEAFNVFNHPNAGNIDPCLCDSTFGQPTNNTTVGTSNPLYATAGPRSLQVVLKLQF